MKTSHGLTLIELMVTLAILAIITVLAFPGFRLYQQNSNRTSQINDLVATFNLAHSEAVRRNLPVIVCASADQLNCNNSVDWSTGWIVLFDDNINNAADATDNDGIQSGGEAAFFIHGALSGADIRLGDVSNAGTTQIIFAASTGISNTTASFMRCDNRFNTDATPNAHARAIILTAPGRTRLSRDNDNNGIQERADNADLDCNNL